MDSVFILIKLGVFFSKFTSLSISGRRIAAQKYALQFRFILKNWTAKIPGDFRKIGRLRGLFGKFDVDGVPVDYWKVQRVFHKIDGLQNHFNKVQCFFYKIHGVRVTAILVPSDLASTIKIKHRACRVESEILDLSRYLPAAHTPLTSSSIHLWLYPHHSEKQIPS